MNSDPESWIPKVRVVSWNCRRATHNSPVWTYFQSIDPDIALVQEVGSLPDEVTAHYEISSGIPVGKKGAPQKFKTAILVKGKIGAQVVLETNEPWVEAELKHFSGNLVARKVEFANGFALNVVSVYSPAWPVDRTRLAEHDVSCVKLTENPNVWLADILWASLKESMQPNENWIVGGDFNLSETFDELRGGPRGNKEYLDRMEALGFTECLKESNGKLTPTFRNPHGGAIKHQMDHMFVTTVLAKRLISCDVGSQDRVFGNGLSDHLPIIADFEV